MFFIRSGIPSLDRMFSPSSDPESTANEEKEGIFLEQPSGTTSVSIAGPDGTGKSVLAMHFASRYLADCHRYCAEKKLPEPMAFYVSTDLSHAMAKVMWENFHLHEPNTRKVPYMYPQNEPKAAPKWLDGGTYDPTHHIKLKKYRPDQLNELTQYLTAPVSGPRHVVFVDLASHVSGDDWGFVERLLAALPEPPADASAPVPRHFLMIDAMEGMETFGGDLDAFGQKTTRRGRVAKLARLAGSKCHLFHVLEEAAEGARLAEQFVANVVLRLRATESDGYTRRTLEIEKARGQSHVRGRHPYVIRDGRGSTTGEQRNFDDPFVENGGKSQSFVDVFPSLHSLSRTIMQNRAPGRDELPRTCAGFGIRNLDEMLATSADETGTALDGRDLRGLPAGSVSALIGDANTQKSFLGSAFLGHAFYDLAKRVVDSALPSTSGGDNSREDDPKRWTARIETASTGASAVVLVTSRDENNRTLAEHFFKQLQASQLSLKEKDGSTRVLPTQDQGALKAIWDNPAFERAFREYLEKRTICRRLEIHDTPSPVLFHVIRRSVEAAQRIVRWGVGDACKGNALPVEAAERAKDGSRIRVVIDDFDSVTRTYGRVHADPLFLPFLLQSLRREGLSTLIIETQSGTHGMPALELGDDAKSDLRALSDYRIFTWHVPEFFGDHRIAIAAIPPMIKQDRKSPVLVRELQWHDPDLNATPRVNPRFEMYAGLDTNKPTLVPLELHLYGETPAWENYISQLNGLWRRVFDPRAAERGPHGPTVVVAERSEDYDTMRDVLDLHANTILDYSLITQVDEFWEHPDVLRPQWDYMHRVPDSQEPEYRGDSRLEEHRESDGRRRLDWFNPDYSLPSHENKSSRLDRVPFTADFGFLACRERLWLEAKAETAERKTATEAGTTTKKLKPDEAKMRGKELVSDTWNKLSQGVACDWVDLLEAATFLARWESARQGKQILAFDLSMSAPETFSCLILEIWFSEICRELIAREGPGGADGFIHDFEVRNWSGLASDQYTLATLVREHRIELYRAWLLLVESMDLNSFDARKESFGFAFGRAANPNAVVIRHWYRSAAHMNLDEDPVGPVRFCRLPGTFSTRGDWFLGVVRGSRSDRLSDRALDLLSSAQGNVDRLMRGLGLPAREIGPKGEKLSSRLRGWHRHSDEPGTLTYAHVLELGANGDVHWLWRSNLRDYHTMAAIWERWLFRVLRLWRRTREFFADDWWGCFEIYRDMHPGKPPSQDVEDLSSYGYFNKMCDDLADELENALPHRSGGRGATPSAE